MKHFLSLLPVGVAIVVLLVSWQVATTFFGVPAYILPAPLDIFAYARDNPDLLGNALMVTLGEAVLGFVIGALIGFAIAVTMVLAPPVEALLLPILVAVNSVPSVAFIPLALLWFGLGMPSKIALAALTVGFVVLLNFLPGLKQVDEAAIGLLRGFGAGRFGVLWRLRLPSAMPSLVTGLRVGFTRSTITVIVAEMLGAYTGIGQMIYQSTAQIDYVTVWAAVVAASLGSLVLYAILVAIDRKLVWWT